MLLDSKKILEKAQAEKYAVGHFNTSDLEITKGIINAAVRLNSPVIIGASEKAISYAGLEELVSIVKNAAETAKIPVILHLDHAKSFESCQKAVQAGFTSIMIDASNLEYEENLKLTKQVVNLAHRNDIPVEAELGAIGTSQTQIGINRFLTDPELAKQFCQDSEIDSLAIAIGNAHGIPQADEKLDFDRLSQIKQNVSIPLVLHGASSTPEEDIKKAISLGICKINIDTDIRIAFNKSIRNFLANNLQNYDPREIMGSVIQAIEKVVEEKIKLFGSENKAGV